MVKTVTEYKIDLGGNTTVEYSDGSTNKFNITDAVTAKTDVVTGGIENLIGVVGIKVGRFAPLSPLSPLSLTLPSDAPTITSSATATISGGFNVSRNDAALTYYSHAGIGEFQGWLTYNNTGRLTQIEFMTNSAALEIGVIEFNTNFRVFVDGKLASAAKTTSSSGSAIYYKLAFSARAIRRITVIGINMPFQELVMTAGDAIWQAPDDMPIACFAGDSFTAGSGGAGGAPLAYSVQAGFALGYRVITDAVGGTGWNTSGADSPLTRLTATGANALVKRIGGVNTSITPALHVAAFGYNDSGGDMTALTSAAAAYIAASSIKPVVVGPWTPAGETANLILVNAALSAVAATANCKFIDTSTFITATNKASLIDTDNIHPVLIGHEYLGQRIAKEIRSLAVA